ncbi:MAG: type II toxin-antitoxin system VapC family toxin [bacterium]|nr:type II toxin-antitoxin system VapC family toxin [bacterium]
MSKNAQTPPPERVFVDTNLFLRYLTNDVPEQAEAVDRLLRRAGRGKVVLVTGVLVIAEIVWTLESFYNLARPDIKAKVLAILGTPGLEVVDANLVLQAIADYAEHNVDFADAFNAAWALDQGMTTAYTFDRRHFARLDGIVVRVPE